MAIHIITGRPGTGKTYILAKKGVEFLKKGREVWSNFKINVDGIHYYTKISQLVPVKAGVILMDEAQIYFNSRNWETLDERLQYKLQQHRKQGLDIWGSVQNIRRLDVIVRELVSHYYEVKKLSFSNESSKHPFGFFVMRQYDVEDAEAKDRHCWGTEWHSLSKKWCNMYDTLASVAIEQDESDKIKTRYFKQCPECGHLKPVGKII